MKTIKLNEKIYKLPESLPELKLGVYQRLMKYQSNIAVLGIKNPGQQIDIIVNTVAILTDIPVNDLYDIPMDSLKQINESLAYLQEVPKKLITSFSVGKKSIWPKKNTYREFNLIPDIKTMSTREYLDFDVLLKNLDASGENLHKIMAILFREKGVKYDTKNLEEKALFMAEHLSVEKVLPALDFIIALGHV